MDPKGSKKNASDSVLLINHDYGRLPRGSLSISTTHSIQKSPRDSSKNDVEPQSKQMSFNMNDKSTRLIFWSILILIVSVAEINFTISMRIYYKTYKQQFNATIDPNPYVGTRFYDILSIASNVFLFVAATLILSGLYKSYAFITKIVTSIMFTIGAIVHLIHCLWGMHLYCIDDPTKPTINNDNPFCRMSFMGSDLYLQLFLIFYVIDILKSYGNNIRVRVFIHSMLLASIGYMNAGNSYHDDKEFSKDAALIFASTIVASGYLIIALICTFIFGTICLVFFSYLLVMNEADGGYTCNSSPIIRKIISISLLIAIGMVLTSPYIYIFVTGSVDEIGTPAIHSLVYYIVGALLFVHDIQYVT